MKKLTKKEIELGTTTTLLERAAHRRLPRLLRIKKSVDKGKRLGDYQIRFLTKVCKDAQRAQPYFDTHPELQDIYVRMVALYHDITEQALKNEKEKLKIKVPPITF